MQAPVSSSITRFNKASGFPLYIFVFFVMVFGSIGVNPHHDAVKQQAALANASQSHGTAQRLSNTDASNPATPDDLGDCPDCNSHHAAAVLPLITMPGVIKPEMRYFSSAIFFSQITVRSNFRPPIV
jgi:hypothetical protein